MSENIKNMVKRPRLSIDSIRKAILLTLYHIFYDYDDKSITFSVIREKIPKDIPSNFIRVVLDDLKSERLIENDFDQDIYDYTFSINKTGLKEIEKLLDEDDIVKKLDEASEQEFIKLLLSGVDLEEGYISNSSDKWEPLPIERSGEKFESAVAGIEEIIKQVRESNGYANDFPEERKNILISLQAGLEKIKEGFITRPQVQTLLIKPINFILKTLAGGAIVEAGKKALQAILDLIGNL